MKLTGVAVTIIILVIASYGAICLGLYLLQERLIFFPIKLPADYQFRFETPFEEVTLPVGQERLHALHFYTSSRATGVLDAPSQSKGVVLYWHGNGGALHQWGAVASFFVEQGYDVVIPDYRGYGKSSGTIRSEATLLHDAEVVYDYVRSNYAPEEIVLYGRSLGSGPATYLATIHAPRLLILEAPYYSMRDMARRQMPLVPAFLLKYPLRNDLRITEIACPVLIVHGANDEVIPVSQGRRLANQLPAPPPLVVIEGGGHNNLEQFAAYRQAVQQALQDTQS